MFWFIKAYTGINRYVYMCQGSQVDASRQQAEWQYRSSVAAYYYYKYYLQFKKITLSSLNEVLWTDFHSYHIMIQWLAAGFVQQ